MSLEGSKTRISSVASAAAGIALLCAMDGVIKHLVRSNDALAVTFGRYVFATLFAGLIWLRAGRPKISRDILPAHLLRGGVIAGSAVCFFWALSVLPLAEAIAISFVAPLLIPFFARAVLGERIRPRSVIACGLGLIGVIVASVGDAGAAKTTADRPLGIAAILAAAVLYALSLTLLRARANRDGVAVVGLLATLIPGLIIAGPALALASAPAPSDLPMFALMGAFGAGGMYFLVKGYAGAEAQLLAPLEYSALLWAAAIGFVFFQEEPRMQVWWGAAIIIAACLWGSTAPTMKTPVDKA